MCHEEWLLRRKRREERFDEELRYLLGRERPRPEPRAPVVERDRDKEPRDPEPTRVEAGARS
jgi:hypothetical protein